MNWLVKISLVALMSASGAMLSYSGSYYQCDNLAVDVSDESLRGDQPIDRVITGKNRIIGCWGNDGVCKVKCVQPDDEPEIQ
jgi:hypothetical protein